jgi:hypothetical protein
VCARLAKTSAWLRDPIGPHNPQQSSVTREVASLRGAATVQVPLQWRAGASRIPAPGIALAALGRSMAVGYSQIDEFLCHMVGAALTKRERG